MAEPLRRVDDFKLDELPETPNMNVVPPPAPAGSADRTTTAGATERGDIIMQGDEVDVSHVPNRLLEPYSEERERQWPLGKIAGGANGLTDRLRTSASNLSDSLRDRAEEWKDRAAVAADSLSHSVAHLSDRLQTNVIEWRHRASDTAQDLRQRSADRAQDLRLRTEQLVNERPAQALAIVAGFGFALGVVLRLGRSRREY